MTDTLVRTIREHYLQVLERIENSKKTSIKQKVKLVVVSKSQPIEIIRAAVEAGVTILGENYAEEAIEKINAFGQAPLEWHMIGHVQRRKATLIAKHFAFLHSLDSIRLANRLNQECIENNRVLPVLMEVNVSGEQSKFGFEAWDEAGWSSLLDNFEIIMQLSHLRVHGLMTMPPYFENPELTRPFFRKSRQLQEFLIEHLPRGDWSELSMGTSVDYQIAVEEGATYVRVGEAILGKRPIHKVIE